ncbi:MAG: F0F1 ATP synthase subunit gamma [Streptococcaceae bacterium]|jgi:F-type H+-transporting ATPase subunit gamma|nr:F0F1 ATP synthase subunit gamma [Streptococcaceae bacterium]
MAGSLNEIKTKIASTRKTSQITNAMQMVSAAKLQKSEKKAKNYQIYAQKVHEITIDLVSHGSSDDNKAENPLLTKRPVKRTGYLVITSDRGLVGGYNTSILKPVMAKLKAHQDKGEEYSVLALGAMGADFFKARGIKTSYELRGVAEDLSFQQVNEIVTESIKLFTDGVFDELYVCYNHHINSLRSSVRMEKMLPITIDEKEVESADTKRNFEFELEPSRDEILDGLLPQYAESMIYGAIVDAKTAEHAAGMAAMKTATDNAHDVIDSLTIAYNRARQGEITQEITEIVAGAAAI